MKRISRHHLRRAFAAAAAAGSITSLIFAFGLTAFGQKAERKPVRPSKPAAEKRAIVVLNDKLMGNAGNLSKLDAQLKRLMSIRMKNGVFSTTGEEADGVVAPPRLANGVYLLVAPDVSLRDVLAVHEVLKKHCTVFLPRPDVTGLPPVLFSKPNPLSLVVMVGAPNIDPSVWLAGKEGDWDHEYSLVFELWGSDDPNDLNFARIFGALEIAADGSMLVNEAYENVDRDRPLDDYPPKVRKIGSSLEEEISKLAKTAEGDRKNLSIIVSGKARYQDLIEVLKLSEKHKLSFEILVDKTGR
jgi:hypothetical protein